MVSYALPSPVIPDVTDILDQVGEAVACLDQQWRFTYVNAKASRVYGKPRHALIGAYIWELFPEFAHSQFEQCCRQAMAQGIPADCELHDPFMDRWYDFRIRPRQGGLCIICRETTDRRAAQRELQDRDLALRTLLSVLPAGVMLLSKAGKCLYVNECGCLMLRMTAHEALGDGWLAAVHPEDQVRAASLACGCSDTLATGDSARELRLCGQDGLVRWAKVNLMREFGDEGSVRGYVLTLLDITSSKLPRA